MMYSQGRFPRNGEVEHATLILAVDREAGSQLKMVGSWVCICRPITTAAHARCPAAYRTLYLRVTRSCATLMATPDRRCIESRLLTRCSLLSHLTVCYTLTESCESCESYAVHVIYMIILSKSALEPYRCKHLMRPSSSHQALTELPSLPDFQSTFSRIPTPLTIARRAIKNGQVVNVTTHSSTVHPPTCTHTPHPPIACAQECT